MGCDIHAVFQCKRGDEWIDIPNNYEENRHYALFAWLAGVRGDTDPISEPRGYPDDFVVHNEDHPTDLDSMSGWNRSLLEEGEEPHVWMGDHSHSWLTADEILSASPQYEEFAYFTDEIRRLRDAYGEVRMVFGFDS